MFIFRKYRAPEFYWFPTFPQKRAERMGHEVLR